MLKFFSRLSHFELIKPKHWLNVLDEGRVKTCENWYLDVVSISLPVCTQLFFW